MIECPQMDLETAKIIWEALCNASHVGVFFNYHKGCWWLRELEKEIEKSEAGNE